MNIKCIKCTILIIAILNTNLLAANIVNSKIPKEIDQKTFQSLLNKKAESIGLNIDIPLVEANINYISNTFNINHDDILKYTLNKILKGEEVKFNTANSIIGLIQSTGQFNIDYNKVHDFLS